MNSSKRNYWMFKTVSDKDRSYQSHDGYDDVLTSKYVYDNNVANSRQIKAGDFVVLVNKQYILGYAKVSRVKESNGTKELYRCPNCGSTNYTTRTNKSPKYRCKEGHEFSVLRSENVGIVKFEAFYGESFKKAQQQFPVIKLKPYFNKGYNRNMSIQSIKEQFFMDIETGLFKTLKESIYYIDPGDGSDLNEPDGTNDYNPNGNDERDKVNRSIKDRRGQPKFRKDLLKRYDNTCCITGCKITHLLEAAHINPYKGVKDNHPSNGLLLRADIHTLFDLDMLGINPIDFTIHLNPEIKQGGYELFQNKKLIGINPSKEALEIRWDLFLKNE